MTMSWREAIERVLAEEARPLHYSEISEIILSKGYYKTEGATPDATVNAQISSSIKHEKEKSPFLRVSRGTFALRSWQVTAATIQPVVALPPATQKVLKEAQTASIEEEPDESVIRCLGMYWQRDLVVWKMTRGSSESSKPCLSQLTSARNVASTSSMTITLSCTWVPRSTDLWGSDCTSTRLIGSAVGGTASRGLAC